LVLTTLINQPVVVNGKLSFKVNELFAVALLEVLASDSDPGKNCSDTVWPCHRQHHSHTTTLTSVRLSREHSPH